MAEIVSTRLMVGLEIHVELATRSKMFTRVGSPACEEFDGAAPNTLIDPVVLGLPGALPVMNKSAVEMSMLVGLAMGCTIAPFTKWDRKSYYYPDLPKAYQISQYDLPLCFDGAFDLPLEDGTTTRIGIIRAHLEEDAGKLLHELPGGRTADFSIVDYNRAGTPLLEIVTAPDFGSADELVAFARTLRNVCRFLGVTEGVMQRGHMRFEPNINLVLELADGRLIKTPIVEIKNLNSFRALKGAVEYEQKHQADRWREDGKVMGPGSKTTRGWNDAENRTFVQREKEDAHDYRYFPDPDLAPVVVDAAWIEAVRSRLPELPHERSARYQRACGLSAKEALALTEERDVCFFFEEAVEAAIEAGVPTSAAWKQSANMVLQSGARRANERGVLTNELGITPSQVAGIIALRHGDEIGSSAADELFGVLCESDADAKTEAQRHNLLQVRDEGAMQAWVDAALADPANAKVLEDIRGGKMSAIGRLIGSVMKASGGQADAKLAQAKIKETLGV